MRELEREATRIAREIEGEDTLDLHLAEVRQESASSFFVFCFSFCFLFLYSNYIVTIGERYSTRRES